MPIPRLRAVRFEQVLPEGRTHPLVLACRSQDPAGPSRSYLVKAIGCPEVHSTWQLVAETMGNVIAARMGVLTPSAAIVEIGEPVAQVVNEALKERGFTFAVRPGPAAGCEFLSGIQPWTVGQLLSPMIRRQACALFAFDLLSQNPDRRKEKVNCGLTKEGIVAFDFEMCFGHCFLPIVGGSAAEIWEPSKSGLPARHLFYAEMRADPPPAEAVQSLIGRLTNEWWDEMVRHLHVVWRHDADIIGQNLKAVATHADEFARDVATRCVL